MNVPTYTQVAVVLVNLLFFYYCVALYPKFEVGYVLRFQISYNSVANLP